MKSLHGILVGCALMAASAVGMTQSVKSGSSASPTGTRYFQLTLVIRYPKSADGGPRPGTQSITTEVAVGESQPGSCQARMTSQVPVTTAGKIQYIETGTKFDCNNVHLEGDGVALAAVLEVSRFTGETIAIKSRNGVDTEEPVISQQSLKQSLKLQLDTPMVVGDFNPDNLRPLTPPTLPSGFQVVAPKDRAPAPKMIIEITAHEVK